MGEEDIHFDLYMYHNNAISDRADRSVVTYGDVRAEYSDGVSGHADIVVFDAFKNGGPPLERSQKSYVISDPEEFADTPLDEIARPTKEDERRDATDDVFIERVNTLHEYTAPRVEDELADYLNEDDAFENLLVTERELDEPAPGDKEAERDVLDRAVLSILRLEDRLDELKQATENLVRSRETASGRHTSVLVERLQRASEQGEPIDPRRRIGPRKHHAGTLLNAGRGVRVRSVPPHLAVLSHQGTLRSYGGVIAAFH